MSLISRNQFLPTAQVALLLGYPRDLQAVVPGPPGAESALLSGATLFVLGVLAGLTLMLLVQLRVRGRHRRSQRACLESETRFRNIVRSTPMGIHLYHLADDGRLVFSGANPAADAQLKVDHQQYVGLTLEEAFPPLAATEIPARYREVCRTGEPWTCAQVRYEHGDIRGCYQVHAFQTGPNMMASMFIDISEQIATQDALSSSEKRFRLFFESSAAATGIASPQGSYLQVNPITCKLLGYSEAELLQRNVLDITHPDDRAMTRQQMAELLGGARDSLDYEKRYLHRDGSVLWGHATASCVRADDGTPLYIAGQVVDITARKQAEAERQAASRQLQGIIDFLPDATLVIDRDQRVIAWNRAMEEKTGVRKEEILGQGDYAYALALYGERRPILIDQIGNPETILGDGYDFIEQRGEVLFAERFLPSFYEGKGAYIWIKASPLRDEQGTLIGAIESIRDITDRKLAEAELRQANRELDDFVSSVSHDLRSPLTPIIGYADHLYETCRERLDPAALQCLSRISNSGTKMLATLNDLLSLAKVGQVEQPEQPVDLGKVVEQVMIGLAGQQAAVRARVTIQDLPAVRIPETLLFQLFDNLIGNALRYACPSGGSITVGGERLDDDRCRLFVADHGPGIPVEERGMIFQVFHRGSAGSGREGTGVGLAIVQKIAKLFNGRAWVDETPGGGSTFRIDLQDGKLAVDRLAS